MINQKTTQSNLLLLLLIISILFCPVMPIMSLSYAIPICLVVIVLYHDKIRQYINKWVFIFVVTIVLATVFSLLFKQNTVSIGMSWINVQRMDIKYCVNIVLSVLIYVSTRALIDYNESAYKIIKNSILITIILFFAGFILFTFNLSLFDSIKNALFQVDVSTQISEYISAGLYQRYTYIFLDPNNGGYFCLMVLFFFIELRRKKKQSTIFLKILVLLVPLMTFSTGNLYCVIFYFAICLFDRLKKPLGKPKIKMSTLIIVTLLIFVVLIIIAFWNMVADNSSLSIFARIFESATNRIQENSLDSRLDNYREIFKSVPPIIGKGYTLIVNGAYFRPHNDHIRILYGYGIVSYIALIGIFVRKKIFKRKYIFLLPVLIASLINSVIDEPRFLFAFIMILAFVNSDKTLDDRRDSIQ